MFNLCQFFIFVERSFFMADTIFKELNIPVDGTRSIVGHYNLDKETDCFVVSYHINNSDEPSDVFVPTRYFLRKVDGSWQNGNYEDDNRFEPIADPLADQIRTHLLQSYYPDQAS